MCARAPADRDPDSVCSSRPTPDIRLFLDSPLPNLPLAQSWRTGHVGFDAANVRQGSRDRRSVVRLPLAVFAPTWSAAAAIRFPAWTPQCNAFAAPEKEGVCKAPRSRGGRQARLARRQPTAAAQQTAGLVILDARWPRQSQHVQFARTASRITRPKGRVAAAVGGLRPNVVGCRQRYVSQRGPRSAVRSQRPGKRASVKPRVRAAADRCVWRDTILNWPIFLYAL